MVFGGIAVVVALSMIGSEAMLRFAGKRGLSQGAGGWRCGESFADNHKRNLELDRRQLEMLERRRPLFFLVIAVGLLAVILGALL